MKKSLSIILCTALLLSSCAQPGGTPQENAAEYKTGTPQENAAEYRTGTETEAAETASAEEEGTGDDAGKPALEIIGGNKEEDYDRAVKNRKSKKEANPDAYKLNPYSAEEQDGTVSEEPEPEQNRAKNYTVMVYIVGSNLESRNGAATQDINEMAQAGLDYDRNNLLLYTGGCYRWVSDIPNDTNNVLDLSRDPGARITARTSESADMGAPETLAEFINYCTEYYPAEHYALILWDHGGGPLWGYGNDELFGNDSLLLEELRAAMDETGFGPDHKLDWVGFDACLMGSIENAALWKDYADYLVSSEEVEAGRGWDYHFLSELNETQDAETIAKAVVDTFSSYYEENSSAFFNPDATLSVMDLSKTEELMGAVDTLLEAMDTLVNNGDYVVINRARSRAKAFGLIASESPEESYDLVDLRDFTEQLKGICPEECAAVSQALDDMIIHAASNVRNTGGVSIYLPGNNKALYERSEELSAGRELISLQYRTFVKSYTDEWFHEGTVNWELEELKEKDGALTLQLTDEQAKNVSQAYYSVLLEKDDRYAASLLRVPIEADQDGTLHIPADPMIVALSTDTCESVRPWSCVQLENKDGVSTYRTKNTGVQAAGAVYDFALDLDTNVEITFTNKDGESEVTLQDVVSEAEGISNGGKESVDISKYHALIDYGSAFYYKPDRDKNGAVLPFWTWQSSDSASISTSAVPVDNQFRFIMRPASSFDCKFACQVVIRDVHGGLYATECRDLPVGSLKEIVEEKTPAGTIQYKMFDDHAEVYRYSGEDETVVVPSSVNGKTVTVIEESAFDGYDLQALKSVVLPDTIKEIGRSAMTDLEEVHLPDGLQRIGNYAFGGYSSEQINIPDSVEFIGAEAFHNSALTSVKLPASLVKICEMPFYECYDLTEITIAEENTNYKTVDGVLYTEDGKTLIQYPHGKGSSYSIEDGTETIAYGAFAEDDDDTETPLRHIDFPDTLIEIENAAFHGCGKLDELVFPDSLEEIGALAFGNYYGDVLFDSDQDAAPESGIETVRIGANIKSIGGKAFSAPDIHAFEVDPENEYYASSGGFITNKSVDTILAVPLGMGKQFIIPEGITTLSSGTFDDVGEGAQYYIPDSVHRYEEDAFGVYTNLANIMIHCSEGSAAESFAKKYNVPYDTYMNVKTGQGIRETETDPDSGITLYWRLFDNCAELEAIDTELTGEADVFEIPSEYRGQPVTALGSDDEEYGFDTYSNISKIIIPDTVQRISYNFLRRLFELETIEVEEGNPFFVSKDGVLFTKAEKLLWYPAEKKEEEYTIPEGTVIIGSNAFCMSYNLRRVVFADSVTTVEDRAFEFAYDLIEVSFNEGLTEIGDGAFGSVKLQNVKLPATLETIGENAFFVLYGFGEIVLPDSLTGLGSAAFYASDRPYLQDSLRIPNNLKFTADSMRDILVTNYEVDADHPDFSTADGLLMSKDGKTLVAVPGRREGKLEVPDGVVFIGPRAFRDCRYLTDVYLPASVKDVGTLGTDESINGGCLYKVHCYEGTQAQRQLEQLGVDWEKIEE